MTPDICRKHMKSFFWRSSQKTVFMIIVRENLKAKVTQKLFGKAWGNSGKSLTHPQNFACSCTYGPGHSFGPPSQKNAKLSTKWSTLAHFQSAREKLRDSHLPPHRLLRLYKINLSPLRMRNPPFSNCCCPKMSRIVAGAQNKNIVFSEL